MGPRRDVTLAEGVVLVQTLGAVRAGRLVRTIDSFEFVGTDKAYSNKLTRIVRKALKGLNKASACTAESLGAYLKSPVFGEAPRLVRISRARGSNQGTRLIRTKIVLLGRAHYYSYVSRFTLRVCDRSANTAPNSEVHPNATLAADGMLAEALQMVEDGDTHVLKNISAAAIDPTTAECPQHKRRRGLPVAGAIPAGFIPYADDGFVALSAEAVPFLASLRACWSRPAYLIALS